MAEVKSIITSGIMETVTEKNMVIAVVTNMVTIADPEDWDRTAFRSQDSTS